MVSLSPDPLPLTPLPGTLLRDNTVKYRWRTLQLLPGMERPSYAGTVVEVLEGLDGQLAVRYQGEINPQPGGAAPSWHTQKFQRLFLTRVGPSARPQRSGQALGGYPGGTRRRPYRRQRPCRSSKGRRHAKQEAHSASDGEVERCAEGEAQGPVDSKCRPRTGHPSGHGEEITCRLRVRQ